MTGAAEEMPPPGETQAEIHAASSTLPTWTGASSSCASASTRKPRRTTATASSSTWPAEMAPPTPLLPHVEVRVAEWRRLAVESRERTPARPSESRARQHLEQAER